MAKHNQVMVIVIDPKCKPSRRTPQCGVDLQIKGSCLKRDKPLINFLKTHRGSRPPSGASLLWTVPIDHSLHNLMLFITHEGNHHKIA